MESLVKKFFILVLIVSTLLGLYHINKYLRDNYFLIYSTGTSNKAFMNSTWQMSPKEIERANKTKLTNIWQGGTNYTGDKKDLYFDISARREKIFFPEVVYNLTDKRRLKTFSSSHTPYLWNIRTSVQYHFFDNKLLSYSLHFKEIRQQEEKLILEHLRNQFGDYKYFKSIEYGERVKNYEWKNNIQTIKLETKNKYSNIKFTYNPIIDEIREIAEEEKKALF